MRKLFLLLLYLCPTIMYAQNNSLYNVDSTGIQGKIILHQTSVLEAQEAFPGGYYDRDYSGQNLYPAEYRDFAKGYTFTFANDTVRFIFVQQPFKGAAGPDLVIGQTTLAEFIQKYPDESIITKTDSITGIIYASYVKGNMEFTFFDTYSKKYNEATMKLFGITVKGMK